MSHYCKAHRGNTSFYPPDMCHYCQTEKELVLIREQMQEMKAINVRLRRNLIEMEEVLDDAKTMFKRLICKPLQDG